MARGRLERPNLDDRTWEEIVAQARALIPTYAPSWTDHNPSDPGITLIELFAWMVEGMIFRLNRVPDKSLIELLNLIGITRDPPSPASTYLTYRLAPQADPLIVPKGHQVSTPQTEENEAIVFEADESLRVLPANLTTALQLYADPDAPERFLYRNVTTRLVGPPLGGLTLMIPEQHSVMLALGFDEATTEAIGLRARFSKPVGKSEAQITWHHSRGELPPLPDPDGDWTDLSVADLEDGTEGFQKNGIVRFSVPPPWDSQNPANWNVRSGPGEPAVADNLCWVGILIRNLKPEPLALGIEHLLFNTVPATNALTIPEAEPERLGTSSGKPFQTFEIRHRPLYKEVGSPDPFGHLRLQVREPLVGGGFGPWEDWRAVDGFPAGAGRFFRLDPVIGEVGFGNHDATASPDGHGSIPPAGSEIAATYRHVAGDARGNVPPNTITVIRAGLTGLVEVRNPGPAIGGSDEEAIEETKRRAPEVLRTRDRAVTVQDYEYLAREATTDVRKARCLPERLVRELDTRPPGAQIGDPWTFGGLNRSRGNVNVIILPDAPAAQPRPTPSAELLQEVSDYLDARRVVGTKLSVTGPRYLPIDVTATVSIWPRPGETQESASERLLDQVRTKITKFLHPLSGGSEGAGWEVGQVFLISGLLEFIQPPAEVGFISSLAVKAGTPLYQPPKRPPTGQSDVWVQLADYEIVCSGDHTVDSQLL
jgi:predicted phage baseplate assembly protein